MRSFSSPLGARSEKRHTLYYSLLFRLFSLPHFPLKGSAISSGAIAFCLFFYGELFELAPQFRRSTGQRAPRSFGKVVVPSLWCPAFCLGVCRRCAPDLQLQPSDVARRNFSFVPFSLLARRSDGFRPNSARSPHS